MTRKKFRVIMVVFVAISVSILTGLSILNFKKRSSTTGSKPQNEVAGEGIISGAEQVDSYEEGLTYFVNEDLSTKRVDKIKEVTLLEINVKLVINNESSKSQNINPDLFKISYDTGECDGLLYDIDYGDIENPIVLQGNGSLSINFKLQYILKETKKLDTILNNKRELKFNYADKQIYVCSV